MTHLKRQKLISSTQVRGYNTHFLLYPRPAVGESVQLSTFERVAWKCRNGKWRIKYHGGGKWRIWKMTDQAVTNHASLRCPHNAAQNEILLRLWEIKRCLNAIVAVVCRRLKCPNSVLNFPGLAFLVPQLQAHIGPSHFSPAFSAPPFERGRTCLLTVSVSTVNYNSEDNASSKVCWYTPAVDNRLLGDNVLICNVISIWRCNLQSTNGRSATICSQPSWHLLAAKS